MSALCEKRSEKKMKKKKLSGKKIISQTFPKFVPLNNSHLERDRWIDGWMDKEISDSAPQTNSNDNCKYRLETNKSKQKQTEAKQSKGHAS